MQLDMHFYGMYALARAAGIRNEAAEKIAYASQFVDDAIDQGIVFVTDRDTVLPTMTSHKPLDFQNAIPNDQWNVWVPFHFLPGNSGNDFYARMTCGKGSDPAMKMLAESLDPKCIAMWPHLIGITAHVFADTFSHYGFIGLCSDNNKVKNDSIEPDVTIHSEGIVNYLKAKWDEFTTRSAGGAAEVVPVGHGAVGTFPDRPFLKWEYKYENASLNNPALTDRHNPTDYLEACRLLHEYFSRYATINAANADPSGPKAWASISDSIKNILATEGPLDERIERWKGRIKDGSFCAAAVSAKDRDIKYNEDLWRPRRAGYASECGGLADSDACRFIRAAHRHRDYVLRELLPGLGLITL